MKSKIKEAFLLSAGLGTRLRPYTETLPKPLVPICGKPLIQWNLELLASLGCTKIIINVHYKKDLLIDYLKSHPIEGVQYIISEEDTLLDTGGGLKNVFDHIEGERFFTWNSDIMLDPRVVQARSGGILDLIKLSLEENNLINLLVRKLDSGTLGTYSELGFDTQMRLCQFLKKDFTSGQVHPNELTNFIFLGITITHRDIKEYFLPELEVFSLTRDIFPGVLRDAFCDGRRGIAGSPCNYYWNDVGNPLRLDEASKEIGNILPLL